MKQLDALTAFLIRLNLVAAEQIRSTAEIPQLAPVVKSFGVGGSSLYEYTYTAILEIKGYPFKKRPPQLLFAHVITWLLDNDSDNDRTDNEDAKVTATVERISNESATVTLSIDFVEQVSIVPDAGGAILWNGKRWRLGTPEIYYALEGDVHEPVDVVTELEVT
jgi:P2 phage tail completion protein R (GpR)